MFTQYPTISQNSGIFILDAPSSSHSSVASLYKFQAKKNKAQLSTSNQKRFKIQQWEFFMRLSTHPT